MTLILASRSASRRTLLREAGISFEARAADVDEAATKARHDGDPASLALRLAEEKALSLDVPGALIIGGDQVLEFEGRAYDKPRSGEEAIRRLVMMGGHTHYLRSGLVLAQDGQIVWRHAGSAAMTMRPLTQSEATAYLDAAGEGVLATVGAYELEGLGARLFERVEGDYFTILGLALLPLLEELRRRDALPW
ncbi:Maf family protein [Parvularcula oceani]|uniref:Maf family protein n=1 Tax=Parvularcula oceani TaxID=1247963 RepID=UPI0004E0D1C0|nr:Maf family protein [Parvularcula oceani]